MIKKLFYTVLILVSVSIVIAIAAIYVSIENTSIVPASQPLSSEDIENIRLLVNKNKPAAILSSKKVKLTLTNSEANKILQFGNQYFEKNIRAKTVFSNNRVLVKLSYKLPSNPVGQYINVSTVLKVNYGKYFIIEEASVGHVSIPSFILKFIQPLIVEAFKKHYGSYFVLWKQVKRVDIYNSTLAVHYQIERTDFKKLRSLVKKVLVDDAMRERITAYALEMDKIINRLAPAGQQSIIKLVSLMFDFAERRSLFNNQTIEENRMALLTLAAYMVGKNPLSYISEKPVAARKKIKFTLKGRHDLAQHYLVSSGINAISNTEWSSAVGLQKELKDSDGGSGFSFVDLMADMAGNKLAEVAFTASKAARLQAKLKRLTSEEEIMGEIYGLQENMSRHEFRMTFGNTSSEEYVRIIREIRRRIVSCSAYKL